MTRRQLERHQVWVYLAAVLLGLAVGHMAPEWAGTFDIILWPVLGVLLYATFTQVPLLHLSRAVRDRRFMAALLIGNFVLVPLMVWGLLGFLPDDPAIRLGVLLVLLVPCTDWFITFSHLGGGDAARAMAATPLNLLLQIALLPVYLWLFMGQMFGEALALDRLATVFVALIILPLAAAWLTERWAARKPAHAALITRLGGLPVPLLALVVFLIAAAQMPAVAAAAPLMMSVIGVFVVFLVAAALLGAGLGRLFQLPAAAARVLAFSFGTRNSFVVLPLALALPSPWGAVAAVIVIQSLVELFGMMAYVWGVPRYLTR